MTDRCQMLLCMIKTTQIYIPFYVLRQSPAGLKSRRVCASLSTSSLTTPPPLCVTRRWWWASTAGAGGFWRSPKPCCSGGRLSASRCPSRMSRSCSGASSLSPPARSAPLAPASFQIPLFHLQLRPLLVSNLVISKPKDNSKDTAGDH